MISIIITSFNEPKTIGRAIDSFVNQDISEEYELIVAAPDKETHEIVKNYQKKNNALKGTSKIKLFVDPGKGKSYALNLLLKKIKGEIIILSDGDVWVSENSVNEIFKKFKDKGVGCVSGKVVSMEERNSFLGYSSYSLCNAAHKLRSKRAKQGNFLECSGYLWAFRNNVVKKFPLDVGEDTIVPIMFYLRDYKIKYAKNAEVYVCFPNKLKDFLKQKIRTAGAHDNIKNYVDLKKVPRMKTFTNEVGGMFDVLLYPEKLKEIFWTFALFQLRLYIWASLFYNSRIKKRKYSDAWKRVESTK